MNNITEMIVSKGISALETAFIVAQNEVPKVAAEFLNYMMFLSILHLFQILLLNTGLIAIMRIFNFYISGVNDELMENEKILKASDPEKRDYWNHLSKRTMLNESIRSNCF